MVAPLFVIGIPFALASPTGSRFGVQLMDLGLLAMFVSGLAVLALMLGFAWACDRV